MPLQCENVQARKKTKYLELTGLCKIRGGVENHLVFYLRHVKKTDMPFIM